jgi:FixJ family two-component response regulator
MDAAPTVFVIDDDSACRDSISALARSMGLAASAFDSAERFLPAYRDEPGCVVVDQCLRGQSGCDLQEELHRRGYSASVIVLTGKAHTQLVVRAMKNGAVTVLDKPCDENLLWQAIRDAVAVDAERRKRTAERTEIERRLATLTESERHVLNAVVAGKPNKAIASQLGSSLRTVESRRSSLFLKLGVQSVAELVAKYMLALVDRPPAGQNR